MEQHDEDFQGIDQRAVPQEPKACKKHGKSR
jgi:hypothetical protein